MAKRDEAARQQEIDQRQVRRHFAHWGVKTIVGLVFGALAVTVWLGWKLVVRS